MHDEAHIFHCGLPPKLQTYYSEQPYTKPEPQNRGAGREDFLLHCMQSFNEFTVNQMISVWIIAFWVHGVEPLDSLPGFAQLVIQL